jgi:hypothetical protein
MHCTVTFDDDFSVELEHVELLGVGVASVGDNRHQGKPGTNNVTITSVGKKRKLVQTVYKKR